MCPCTKWYVVCKKQHFFKKKFGRLEENVLLCTRKNESIKKFNKLKKRIIMSEIESKIKQIIVDKLGVDEAEVKPEASFTNDLGADSLDTVELIMELEKEFGVNIPDDMAEKISTVGDAIKFIEENQK